MPWKQISKKCVKFVYFMILPLVKSVELHYCTVDYYIIGSNSSEYYQLFRLKSLYHKTANMQFNLSRLK